MLWLILVLCVSAAASEQVENIRKSYEGYKVLDVFPRTVDDVKFLQNLMITTDWLDFWQEPSRALNNVTIMVPAVRIGHLEDILDQEHLIYSRFINNVQGLLDPMWEDIDRRDKAGRVFNIDDFNTLSDIYGWLLTLSTQCRTGLFCQAYSVGNSHQGNPILVFRMYQSTPNRKAYWIDSTIHAREWIAPATTLKVIDAMARGTNPDAVRLTNTYDWYIMPVMNPDGYDFTWSNDRLWRKNRRPSPGSLCIGADLNRNFNFRWGTDGVSHLPCSDIYCGSAGGSEPETAAVQNELIRLGPTLLAAVTVHSYGNMWMFPWGNTVNHAGQTCQRADDHNDLMRVSDATANAIQGTYGTNWARGNSCEVIYETSGGTDDFAKGVAGIKYSFCPELRGNSFVIPAAQIQQSYTEFYNGIVAMVAAING